MMHLSGPLEQAAGRRARRVIEPECKACQDMGCNNPRYSPDPDGGAEQTSAQTYCIACGLGRVTADLHQAAAKRLVARWVEYHLQRVGRQLPPGLAAYTLASYVEAGGTKELVHRLVEWFDTPPSTLAPGLDEEPWQPWLYISGDVGAGKTGAVVPFLLEHIRRGNTGAFITVPDWLASIRDSYGSGSVGADEVSPAYAYQEVGLLVLDDMGVERVTDWAVEQLFMLINYRATHRRRTIITSNLNLHDLRQKLSHEDRGRRIPSRIQEMCWGDQWVISLHGPDLRLRGKANERRG